MVVVAVKVNIELPPEIQAQSLADKLRRIDVIGSLSLVSAVGCFLLALDLKGTEEIPWSHPLIYGLLTSSVISCILFFLAEKYWAPFPVMPLRLVSQRTPLAVSFANLFASMAAFSMVRALSIYLWAVQQSTDPCLCRRSITSRWYLSSNLT